MDQIGNLWTRRDLSVLGPTFDRLWPIDDMPSFETLLRAVDRAEAKSRAARRPPVH